MENLFDLQWNVLAHGRIEDRDRVVCARLVEIFHPIDLFSISVILTLTNLLLKRVHIHLELENIELDIVAKFRQGLSGR